MPDNLSIELAITLDALEEISTMSGVEASIARDALKRLCKESPLVKSQKRKDVRHFRIGETQKRVLFALQDFIEKEDRVPSVRELAKHLDICSTSVHHHLKKLQEKGVIKRRDDSFQILSFPPSRS